MNRHIRRALTVAGSAVGAVALFTGTAAAHYCYNFAPAGTQRADSTAWATAEETADEVARFLPPGDCLAAAQAHILELGENGALFMGPGLLAGGAVPKGKGPASVGHLIADLQTIDACASLFEEQQP